MGKMKIAVVGLQGAVEEHIDAVEKAMRKAQILGHVIWVRTIADLKDADGIILPGGESTTIGKLALKNKMHKEIIKLAKKGIPIMGTCAGAILLAKKLGNDKSNSDKRLLNLLDIGVERNAYGRQKDSFEAEVNVKGIGKVNGIFIRAPKFRNLDGATALAMLGKDIVGVEKGNIIALAFHPELTDDLRIHKYFLQKCLGR